MPPADAGFSVAAPRKLPSTCLRTKCVLYRRRCYFKNWEFHPNEILVHGFQPCACRHAVMGRRPGGRNSIDACQAESVVRAVRSEETTGRIKEAAGFQWWFLRVRR